MNTYNFYQQNSESFPLIYSGSFADDASAIDYLPSLPVGVYLIQKVLFSSPSVSYEASIYGPA